MRWLSSFFVSPLLLTVTVDFFFHFVRSMDATNIYLLSPREYQIVDKEYIVYDTLKNIPRVPYVGLWHLTDRGTLDSSVEPTSLFESNETYANNDCVKRLFGNDTSREVIVYLHGIDNDMKGALKHAKEMRRGLVHAQQNQQGTEKKDYTIVIFDWPSILISGYASWLSYIEESIKTVYYLLAGYSHDSEMADTSMRSLKYLVYALMSANIKTHVLGHSMGARIVLNMFNSITHDLRVMHRILEKANNDDDLTKTPEEVLRKQHQKRVQHLGHIILKQGDIDMTKAAEFVTKGIRTVRFYENSLKVFVFHRDDDEKLHKSTFLRKTKHSKTYRVGETEGAIEFERMCTEEHVGDAIQLMSASTYITDTSNHHSYYKSDAFWKDVYRLLLR